ncbi:ZIP family metal transporter [Candidatus Roizmanbacteria bacterium]|nr:ZIP family metal transporter [Candidatus Roizmanbacteria bacterium]
MEAIIFAVTASISTFVGGLFSLRHHKRLHYIMSFTAGVLIAVSFFDIIPEIFRIVTENKLDMTMPLIMIVVGFLTIHVLEKYAVIHSSHEGEYADHRHPHVGMISASGLIFHSFLDGVGIGLGFHANAHIGLIVALAVVAHDFSDGLNTVSLMLVNKNTKKKAFTFLLGDALAPIIGVVATYIFQISDAILVVYLGFFAGFLLYIGSSDLLPEAHSQHSSWKMIGLTIVGVAFIFLITRLTK